MGMPTSGGPSAVGIESSIVDCTRGQSVLDKDDVQAIGNTPRASGTLESHYAPNAKVRLMDASAMQTALDLLGADAAHIAVYARTILRIQSPNVLYCRMSDDALATAQQVFSVLRSFDAQRVRLIWVETLLGDSGWDGVRDRLGRAARVEGLGGVDRLWPEAVFRRDVPTDNSRLQAVIHLEPVAGSFGLTGGIRVFNLVARKLTRNVILQKNRSSSDKVTC